MEVKYKDLSGWLKCAFIYTIVSAGLTALMFLVFFIQGLLLW